MISTYLTNQSHHQLTSLRLGDASISLAVDSQGVPYLRDSKADLSKPSDGPGDGGDPLEDREDRLDGSAASEAWGWGPLKRGKQLG